MPYLELADWIEKEGGVQEIKLGQSETFVSMADKAEMAKEHFDNMKALGTASSEMLSLTADADFMGDRCVLIEMNAGDPEEYLPLAKKLVESCNVVLNDEDILAGITLANGSMRNLFHSIERLARRKGIKNGQ